MRTSRAPNCLVSPDDERVKTVTPADFASSSFVKEDIKVAGGVFLGLPGEKRAAPKDRLHFHPTGETSGIPVPLPPAPPPRRASPPHPSRRALHPPLCA